MLCGFVFVLSYTGGSMTHKQKKVSASASRIESSGDSDSFLEEKEQAIPAKKPRSESKIYTNPHCVIDFSN